MEDILLAFDDELYSDINITEDKPSVADIHNTEDVPTSVDIIGEIEEISWEKIKNDYLKGGGFYSEYPH